MKLKRISMMSHVPKLLIFALLPVMLCGCGAMEAQGPLKNVLEGKSNVRTPEEQKKFEETQRQLNQQTPPPNEDNGAVGFKIPL
jgi:hypothetical protein